MDMAPAMTVAPIPRRMKYCASMPQVMVCNIRKWYISSTMYKAAVIYNSRFLSNIEKMRISIQATEGMSKRVISCTPKKKNPTINNPEHKFS